jgi:hypothetical protein
MRTPAVLSLLPGRDRPDLRPSGQTLGKTWELLLLLLLEARSQFAAQVGLKLTIPCLSFLSAGFTGLCTMPSL